MRDMWTFREETWVTTDLKGFKVEALDGEIGSIDEKTNDVGSSYLVVDTGPWIFGKKVMLLAGVVQRVDQAEERVYVNRTKDEIKNAPEFDEQLYHDQSYRSKLGDYYGRQQGERSGIRS